MKSRPRKHLEKKKERLSKCISTIIELMLVSFLIVYSIFRAALGFILPRRYKDISNEVILITGGGRGLGRVLAVEFAKYKPKQVCHETAD